MSDIYSVLITGASQGIGLEFVKQFLTNPTFKSQIVIATSRVPERAVALQELQKNHSNLYVIKLNLNEFDTHAAVASEVGNIVGEKGLTILINNAAAFTKMHDLESLNGEDLMSILATNTVGPLLLTKAVLPLLKLSAQVNAKKTNNGLCISRAAVINISSCCGSILLAGSDEWRPAYGYRESKAAMNMMTQSMSKELHDKGILTESLHPGYVITPSAKPDFTMHPFESVTGMLKVMLRLKEKNKNYFYDWKGDLIPF